MSSKKSILAVLVAFVISNVLTTIYYMLTNEANMVPYRREEINYAALMVNHLIYAGILVYLFPAYYQKLPKLSNGFFFGVLMAAMMFVPQALVVRAIWTVDINTIFFANTLAHLVIGGIIGLAVALIYGNKKQSIE